MKKLTLLLLLGSLAAVGFTACGNVQDSKPQMKNPPKHVIMVGFDGLSSHCITHGAVMPTYRKLMENGAYTVKNRSILPSSSACNWASMFMGAGPELHGYTQWDTQTPDLPSRVVTENGLFPDIYYQIRQVKPEAELGYIYQWNGMRHLVDKKSINYFKGESLSGEDTQACLASTLEYIKTQKPDFCSIIFDNPDCAGHTFGWDSEEYYNMVTHVDKALAEIVKAIDEAGMTDETILILTSDHGGLNRTHGGKTMNEMETTIVFAGKGIKKGFEIPESTMVYDIASTIGYIFGINQPQVWIGRPIRSIFE